MLRDYSPDHRRGWKPWVILEYLETSALSYIYLSVSNFLSGTEYQPIY